MSGRAQNLILELRSARRDRDDACRQNQAATLCQEAEAHYQLVYTEYQNFLAGVDPECRGTLPDPATL